MTESASDKGAINMYFSDDMKSCLVKVQKQQLKKRGNERVKTPKSKGNTQMSWHWLPQYQKTRRKDPTKYTNTCIKRRSGMCLSPHFACKIILRAFWACTAIII